MKTILTLILIAFLFIGCSNSLKSKYETMMDEIIFKKNFKDLIKLNGFEELNQSGASIIDGKKKFSVFHSKFEDNKRVLIRISIAFNDVDEDDNIKKVSYRVSVFDKNEDISEELAKYTYETGKEEKIPGVKQTPLFLSSEENDKSINKKSTKINIIDTGSYIFTFKHEGLSLWAGIAKLYYDGKEKDGFYNILVNSKENYSGQKVITIPDTGNYVLNVSAIGSWTIQMEKQKSK